MTAPPCRWIKESSLLAIHEVQVAEHGGSHGIRDIALLQSALARPQNAVAYGSPDIADLAAAYAVGIARNHPFLDGNKRTAWVVAETFLLKNGYELMANNRESLPIMLSVAEGASPEAEFAAWLRAHIEQQKN